MSPLVKVTSVPYSSFSLSQNARLVPSDAVDMERRKAIARHMAIVSRMSGGGGTPDVNYIRRVNQTFYRKVTPGPAAGNASFKGTSPKPAEGTAVKQSLSNSIPASSPKTEELSSLVPSSSGSFHAETAAAAPISEPVSAYNVQRSSLELRALKGDLTFVPPLVMTIVTQYPSIHFEYTGGFNYVPPRDDSGGSTSLTI